MGLQRRVHLCADEPAVWRGSRFPMTVRSRTGLADAPVGGSQAAPWFQRGRLWILLVIILMLGGATRFVGLSARSLGFDEAFAVSLRTASVSQLAGFIRFHDTGPPLHYLLLKAWT